MYARQKGSGDAYQVAASVKYLDRLAHGKTVLFSVKQGVGGGELPTAVGREGCHVEAAVVYRPARDRVRLALGGHALLRSLDREEQVQRMIDEGLEERAVEFDVFGLDP